MPPHRPVRNLRRPPRRGAALLVLLVLLASATVAVVAGSAAAAPVTVQNPSLETQTVGVPDCFEQSGYGTNTVTWAKAATAHTGTYAQSVTVSGYTNGDRKLLETENATCAPAVTPGSTYDLGIWYQSTTASTSLTVFRHSTAGWAYWTDIKTLPAATAWTQATGTTPVVPDGTDQITFGISLVGNGTLSTDDYSLTATGTTAPPTSELSTNTSLETGGTPPTGWELDGWGDATVTGAVTTAAHTGTRAYSITMANRTQGDYKLLPTAAASPKVQPGVIYQLSAWYHSTSASNSVTVFSHTSSGWAYWTDITTLPAVTPWTQTTVQTPAIPAGVDSIAWGISIYGNGTLVTDDYSTTAVTTVTAPPTGPAGQGQWSVLDQQMPIRAMHATLLDNGKVLLMAGSGNDVNQFAAGTFKAAVWDPIANTWTVLTVPKDMFCSGHVTLPDGRVLIQGGTKSYPTTAGGADYGGLKDSWIFDPATNTFTTEPMANEGHWYPTLTELGNGDVWMAGGLKEDTTGAVNTEMWSTRTSTWLPGNQVPQSWSFWGLYPHMFLLQDGRLFYSGGHVFGNGLPGAGASIYTWQTGAITDVQGLRDKDLRDQSASVLLPPAQDQKFMITGGGNIDTQTPGIGLTDLINLNDATPAYTPGPDLPGMGKMYLNATILPDRTVLVTNGAQLDRNSASNVFTAAVYNPATNAWTSVAADPVGRNYHSTALLLPDGRVAVFGSNPGDGSYELRVSMYSPSYLFHGQRPQISATPTQLTYGQTFTFTVSTPGSTLRWAQLMRPMSVTHQMDSNMRLVDLPVTVTNGVATATVTTNPNLLPPGPYMLNVTNSDGVPSTAAWVMIK